MPKIKVITMPSLSPTMTTGVINTWVKTIGQEINIGDVIAEIETDKAVMEMESPFKGVLCKILVQQGQGDIPIQSPIALLATSNVNEQEIDDFIASMNNKKTASVEVDLNRVGGYKKSKEAVDVKEEVAEAEQRISNVEQLNNSRILITPYAKTLAAYHNIDYKNIKGTGKHGFINAQDIENAKDTKNAQDTEKNITKMEQKTVNSVRIVQLSGMRKAIARKMTQSLSIPHFYVTANIDVSRVVQYKVNLAAEHNIKTTLNDWFLLACAKALKAVPTLNQTWAENSDELQLLAHEQVDINCAMDVGLGPMLALIHNVGGKSLSQVSKDVRAVAERAKNNQLQAHDLQTGSFSVSNLGMYGVAHFQAIINAPQVAMLAIGGAGADNMCAFTLACDHRAVDGRESAIFLQELRTFIQNPIMLVV